MRARVCRNFFPLYRSLRHRGEVLFHCGLSYLGNNAQANSSPSSCKREQRRDNNILNFLPRQEQISSRLQKGGEEIIALRCVQEESLRRSHTLAFDKALDGTSDCMTCQMPPFVLERNR